ncbi:unnamed protein product [Meloidogyne enterolobii]|uniref:Uncharacterized protein n=1 Tax=Meloidogyne enterolobii TaxID=390850 RepID=A0ACB0ZKT2_MELEN
MDDILDVESEMGENALSSLTPEEEQQLLNGNKNNKQKIGEENVMRTNETQTSPAHNNAQNICFPYQIPNMSIMTQQFLNMPVMTQQFPNQQMYAQFPNCQMPMLMPMYPPQFMQYSQIPTNNPQNFPPQMNNIHQTQPQQTFQQPVTQVAQPPINSETNQRPTTDFAGFMHSFDRMSLSWALDKIPDLKGPEGVDQIKTFFKKFDSATEGISDVVRLKALESKISGRAERAFNTALGNSPFIYSSVRREMLRILETTDTKEICAFDELMSGVKRRENENIDSLANRIASLVKRAYPGMTNNLLDEYSIKHLIRSIGDSNLALNLEIARQDGMSFDSFVSLAARAESTQKATRHINFQSKPPVQQFSQRNNNFTPRNEITCFNCGKPGHLSRDCLTNRNNQYMSKDNVAAATGANRTFLNTKNNINEPNRNAAVWRGNGQPRALPPSGNQLKNGCITIHDEIPKNHVNSCGINILEIKEELKKIPEQEAKAEIIKNSIGPVMSIKVNVKGLPATGMLDGGAQISLISSNFLLKMLKDKEIELKNIGFSRAKTKISDVNGQKLECHGIVELEIKR